MSVGRRRGAPLGALPRTFFHEEAGSQRVCGGCGKGGAFQAHHVIYAQHVRIEGGNEWDRRNAMRLCHACHARHHNRQAPLPVRRLPPAALEFAAELFGAGRAAHYLQTYYDDRERDPRLETWA